jgi:hypothetical protein
MPIDIGGLAQGAAPYVTAGAQVAGDVFAYKGQQQTNASNAEQAQKQMEFQRDMSSTAYQRAVDDMRKAGLNPALAYQQGGASTPSGAAATMQNSAAALKGSAGAAAQTFQTVQQQAAATKQIEANTNLTDAQTRQLNIESADRLRELQTRIAATSTNAQSLNTLREFQSRNLNTDLDFKVQSFATRLEQLKQDINNSMASARDTTATATLKELAQPDARNAAKAAMNWYGRNLTPYLTNARQTGQALTSFVPAIKLF